MNLEYSGGTFILNCTFDERFTAKNAGFRWQPDIKKWTTTSSRTAQAMAAYATPDCRRVLAEAQAKRQEALAQSMATEADLDIPHPEGGPDYRPYQKAGVKFFLKKNPVRCLCGDEAGVGKSAQAIGLINMREDIKSVLIVAPASLKINWRRELEMWLTRNLSVGIVSADKGVPCADILICNYDILGASCDCWKKLDPENSSKGKKRRHLKDCPRCNGKGFFIRLPGLVKEYDLVVADESHRTKNDAAMCAKAFKAIATSTHRLALSGTPLLNRPIELFSTINWLDHAEWPSKWEYAKRYCGLTQTRFGVDMSGATNLDELATRLRTSGIMIRRMKRDVMKELPPKIHQVVELPDDGLSDCINAEWSAYRKQETLLAKLKAAVEIAKCSDTDAEYHQAINSLKDGVAASFHEMSYARMDLAKRKIPYIITHISDMMEDGQKIIVFGHHTEMLEAVYSKMSKHNPAKITGSTSMIARDKAVQLFQHDNSCRLFVGNIIAAGVGITLTASSTVVLAELDWRPGICSQAADRAHRLGQRDSVLVQYLVVSGSLDAYIAKKIAAKAQVIEKALGTPDLQQDEAEAVILPDAHDDPQPSASRKQIAESSARVQDGDMEVAMQCLRIITAMDTDFASGRNTIGWSRFDSAVGHSLSEKPCLSPKQVSLAVRLCNKHRKQLGSSLAESISSIYKRLYEKE